MGGGVNNVYCVSMPRQSKEGREAPIGSQLVFDLPSVSEPALSPDGERIAYVRGAVDGGTMVTRSWLESIPSDGGEGRALTRGPSDRHPLWSPDGDRLAFLRRREGERWSQIWLLDVAGGGEARPLSALPRGVLGFQWSPDGDSLACFGDVGPDPLGEGETPRGREVHNLYFRGDTVGYRYDLRRHLFTVDAATGGHRQVTRGDYEHFHPCYSPDGKTLAFAATRAPRRHERLPLGTELCVMPASGGRVRRLTPDVAGVAGIAWSPDGRDLACVVSELDEAWQPYLEIIEVRSGRRRRISDDTLSPQTGFFPVLAPPLPVWRRDRVIVVADRAGSSRIVAVTREGHVEILRSATEAITSFTVATRADRLAVLRSGHGEPPEIHVQPLARARGRAVTAVTRPFLVAHRPGQVERFSLRRAGFTIDCGLLLPPSHRSGQRHPLVLEIHGGPNSFFVNGFNPLHQILAGAGFAVLFTNPRGSTTYGSDFAAQVRCDWGGEDYLDLMAAVDAACERDDVDPRRLGVHGYSYGGYMTSWIVGHTHRFRAAVVGAPVTNLWSMYGQTDIGVPWAYRQFGGRPTDRLAWYIERSPLTYADRVKTPVLLLHGEADHRCPIGQSEELYVALKERRKVVEFVRFPDCSHLFLRGGHPALKREYYDRVVAWFHRFLTSAPRRTGSPGARTGNPGTGRNPASPAPAARRSSRPPRR